MLKTLQPINYWRDDKCAKAFWSQDEIPAYRDLLKHTSEWLAPKPGDCWLDLGCGAGRLSKLLWQLSGGKIQEVTGTDVAALNEKAYAKLREQLQPRESQVLRFLQSDMSSGLSFAKDQSYDGIVSGLAIQYTESYSEVQERWTTTAYDALLEEIYRVLKPDGSFVFSVNVPNPAWWRVAMNALKGFFKAKRKPRYLLKLYRMWHYGGWLTRESRKGRFHYLPAEVIVGKLNEIGFQKIEYRLSYAKHAYVFRCVKA